MLRDASAGYDEWRVQNPIDGSYCMSFSRHNTLMPERDAREWLADTKKNYPRHEFALYEVACTHVYSEADKLRQAAADRIEADAARIERLDDELYQCRALLSERVDLCAAMRDEVSTLRAKAERVEAERDALKTVMIAAAEELSAHWQAHCDAEGYGPQNLLRRLEEGIPSEYGYTAGAFSELTAEVAALREDAERYRWLRANAKESPLRPKLYAAEMFPDTRLQYQFPTLMSWADYCGQIELDAAIDAARKEQA